MSTIFLGFVLCVINVQSTEASEKDTVLEEKMKEQTQKFIELGIDEKTAIKLTKKVARGELLDAQKKSEVNKLEEEEFTVDMEEPKKFVEFDDGSRIKLSLEPEVAEEPTFSTLDYSTGVVGTNSCKTGSGYKTCNVTAKYYDGVWDIRFNAVVNLVQNGYDSISSISRQAADVSLYTVSEKKFGFVRRKETSTQGAKADYTNQFTVYGGFYSISRTLSLYAKNDKMFARLNFY